MFRLSDFLRLSTLLLAVSTAVAHPASGTACDFPIESIESGYAKEANVQIGYSDVYAYSNSGGLQYGGGRQRGDPGGQGGCEIGGAPWRGGNGGSRPPCGFSDDTTHPTSTVTVTMTVDNDGLGSAIVTATVSHCMNTVTEDSIPSEVVTKTDTLILTISECTSTKIDVVTVTEDSPTITETTTTSGPTVTDTITLGASTVTEPGSTETETVTDTVTDNETTTYTHHIIITETDTATETQTLEITTTMTSYDCSETDDGSTIDYGTCSDPTIKWAYGLDGRNHYSFTTNNQHDFPFGSDTSIGSVTGLICNRLRSPCNAPQATIDRCTEAANAANLLSGQEAADIWNWMMT